MWVPSLFFLCYLCSFLFFKGGVYLFSVLVFLVVVSMVGFVSVVNAFLMLIFFFADVSMCVAGILRCLVFLRIFCLVLGVGALFCFLGLSCCPMSTVGAVLLMELEYSLIDLGVS